jgi:DNA repair exonuclease SbcCD ATPase subunit
MTNHNETAPSRQRSLSLERLSIEARVPRVAGTETTDAVRRKIMNRRAALAFVIASFMLLMPAETGAQDASPGDDAVRSLLKEVRQLREAVEKQSSATMRAQMLVTRLNLQDQRITKARGEVDEITNSLEHLRSSLPEYRLRMEEMDDEDPKDEKERKEAARYRKQMKEMLALQEARVPALEAKLETARQRLQEEQARYDELDGLLGRLDGELASRVAGGNAVKP